MSLAGVKKELRDLKKGYAPNFKTVEELQKMDIHKLTDEELFRLIQVDCPEFKTLEELTDDILKACVEVNILEPAGIKKRAERYQGISQRQAA